MTDECLTAESVTNNLLKMCYIRNSFISNDPVDSRTTRDVFLEEIQKYGDQRATKAVNKFQGLICTCVDEPCGSGICISSPISIAFAGARKATLEESK